MASSSSLPVSRAVALELARLTVPVVLRYDIARIAWRLYKDGVYDEMPLANKLDKLDLRAFNRLERTLLDNGVLIPLPGVTGRGAYTLIGASVSDRNAIICSVDPFCYLSHLSAMEFHGLTDRLPQQIYISTPSRREWSGFAQDRMAKDLGEDYEVYRQSRLPLIQQVALAKIGQHHVHRFSSIHRGAFRAIKDSPVRVATIGRTFLDMLRESDLCGGMVHVIQVFKEHAGRHKRLILDELDQNGGPIDKVRTGFILEEVCQIHDPRIDAWIKFAARGGSRRLDPSVDYEPEFSERWMLSINATLPDDGE